MYSYVETDEDKIKEILFVLLYNAIKYTVKGFIKVKAKLIKIHDDHELIIKVQDSGCGMS